MHQDIYSGHSVSAREYKKHLGVDIQRPSVQARRQPLIHKGVKVMGDPPPPCAACIQPLDAQNHLAHIFSLRMFPENTKCESGNKHKTNF